MVLVAVIIISKVSYAATFKLCIYIATLHEFCCLKWNLKVPPDTIVLMEMQLMYPSLGYVEKET